MSTAASKTEHRKLATIEARINLCTDRRLLRLLNRYWWATWFKLHPKEDTYHDSQTSAEPSTGNGDHD